MECYYDAIKINKRREGGTCRSVKFAGQATRQQLNQFAPFGSAFFFGGLFKELSCDGQLLAMICVFAGESVTGEDFCWWLSQPVFVRDSARR